MENLLRVFQKKKKKRKKKKKTNEVAELHKSIQDWLFTNDCLLYKSVWKNACK